MPISPTWPAATTVSTDGAITSHGRTAEPLLDESGLPLYLTDTDEVVTHIRHFVRVAAEALNTSTTHMSLAGKAFLSKEIMQLVAEAGMFADTCTMGEMKATPVAGVPGRRLVLHGNNKLDEEIALAIEQGFVRIVISEPGEPERIAAIARKLGKRARVILRVIVDVYAGGHEYISTAHEDQKFGVPLLAAGVDTVVLDMLNDFEDVTLAAISTRISATHSPENGAEKTEKSECELHYDIKYPYDLGHEEVSGTNKALAVAMETIVDGPPIVASKTILANQGVLELVRAHSHIGSNIHDADVFIHAAKCTMLLCKTLWATGAYILPKIDLGDGYSVTYTDGEDSMDIDVEFIRSVDAVSSTNRALGMPAPAISFEPSCYIAALAGVALYRVGTIKRVHLPDARDSDGNLVVERVYVSVDGDMSDNTRPAFYGVDYTTRLANRTGSAETMLAHVYGMHRESGGIVIHEAQLPTDLECGDILVAPVTGTYGRTMASNYNQTLIPMVVAVSEFGAYVILCRQTVDDLPNLDIGE